MKHEDGQFELTQGFF